VSELDKTRRFLYRYSYFTLWLREYTVRYKQWIAQMKFVQRESRTEYKHRTSSDLAWFYARCKQTVLTPNSIYEV
jgi:hypothetical protein